MHDQEHVAHPERAPSGSDQRDCCRRIYGIAALRRYTLEFETNPDEVTRDSAVYMVMKPHPKGLWLSLGEVEDYLAQLDAREAALRTLVERIIEEMRNERPRYKSHDLGFVDSVSASRVDEWADELAEVLR